MDPADCAEVGFSTAAPSITPSSGLVVLDGPDERFVFLKVFFGSAIGRSTLQGLQNNLRYALNITYICYTGVIKAYDRATC